MYLTMRIKILYNPDDTSTPNTFSTYLHLSLWQRKRELQTGLNDNLFVGIHMYFCFITLALTNAQKTH